MTIQNKQAIIDVFESQFFLINEPNDRVHQAIDRVIYYLYYHSDVHHLEQLTENHLIGYLKYHHQKQFSLISFVDAITDIKIFQDFLQFNLNEVRCPSIDLSLLNIKLWLNL